MSTLVEMLSGVLRYFPNTMISTLFVVGIMMGRLSWVLVALGGIVVTIGTLTIQYLLTKTIGGFDLPGDHFIKACSLLPVAQGGHYMPTPSLWIALTSFFTTYIFTNALNVYSQTPPSTQARYTISVQQRKGVGLISTLAIIVLAVFLVVARYMSTDCENILGIVLGLTIGIAAGYFWWLLLDACGADVYPDIHGVMIGSKPGLLRNGPVACAKM